MTDDQLAHVSQIMAMLNRVEGLHIDTVLIYDEPDGEPFGQIDWDASVDAYRFNQRVSFDI